MKPKTLQTTPTKAPYTRSDDFVNPLQTPPLKDQTNKNGNSQPPASTGPSSQRPTLTTPPKPTSPAKPQRPTDLSNTSGDPPASGFNIHRPSGRAPHQSAARPVLATQKAPPSTRPNGHPAPGGFATQRPNARPPHQASGPFPARPHGWSSGTGSRPQGSQPAVRIAPRWTRDAEAKFIVDGLPPEWYTKEIHKEMLALGNVTYVEIPQEQSKPGSLHAYVTFTPPPKDYVAIQRGLVLGSAITGRRHEITFVHKAQSYACYGAQSQGNTTVTAARIDFGVMRSEDTMLGLHSVRGTPHEAVEVSTNTEKKRLEIGFSVPSSLFPRDRRSNRLPAQSRYRMEINFAQLSSIVQMQDPETGETSLVLSTEAPPLVYRKTDKPLESHEPRSRRWNEWKTWYRQTEIEQNPGIAKQAVKQLQRDNPIIDLGRWLTYRLTFDSSSSFSKEFRELQEVLEAHSIFVMKDQIIKSQFAATKAMVMWSWLDSPVAALGGSGDLSSLSDLQQMAHQTIQLPFDVRYQLESCISYGCIHECNVDQEFLEKLAAMATESEHSKLRAIKLLEKVVDEGRRFYDPNEIFKRVVPNMRNAFKQRQQTAHFIKVLTATVTPTAIYFNAPSLEPSNRVVRHFRQHENRFLRVRFSEEKYRGKIYSSEEAQDNEVFTRVKRTMTNGIKVGDRVYEFLAFGNSQFREHGAYFFAPTGDLNASKIRDWMGNFTHIKVVAKYCSRIGQCLSTTRATQNKTFKEIKIPDIERNGFCFTDGVGKISPMLAILISSEIGMLTPHAGLGKSEDYPYPSAFQFRMGGCKGVLVVDPTMGSERSVAIRPSQEKFSMMKHTGLEICRISQFTNASLNVQIILVLSGLGVEDKVFTDMMDVMLSDLTLAMTNESKAIELLQKNIDLNQMTVQIAQMILDGFMERQDPFMMSCLLLWRSWSLKYLKEKQRIFVEQGAFVLGCIDETATLEGHRDSDPGALPEIFLQIPDREHGGRYKVVEGVCMLARNPSLHPGDVSVVRAVPSERLKHIRDCVVLPQQGDRDIANMCSGGDLDGDDYMVIWDEQLLPKEWNHPPMNYEAPAPVEAEGEITVDDMTSFFVTHMKYDNVGKIATLHRCWADRELDGVKSAKCLELAALHSKAVDYAKTGQPAELPKELMMGMRPHWYEKSKKRYHSNKIIGQLYDKVKREDFVPAWDLPFDARILEAYPLDEEIFEKAKDIKEQYDEAICRVMAKYKIRSEFEVWSTFVLEHGEDYNDYKFVEKIGEEVFTLKERFQKLCHEQISADEKEQKDWSKKGPFVAAMYAVTAREVQAALEECEKTKVVGGVEVPVREKSVQTMPFMSFPWLFPNELGWIANKRAGYAPSTALRADGPKQVQQAAKARVKEELLGDVPQVAPLEELVIAEEMGDDGEEEDDLIDIQYTGPKFVDPQAFAKKPVLAAPVAKDSVVDFTAEKAMLAESSIDLESNESSTEAAWPPRLSALRDLSLSDTPEPLQTPQSPDSSPTPAVDHSGIFATPLPDPISSSSQAAVGGGSEIPALRTAAEEGEDSEEEAEEVVLAVPAKKSALDKLEELLES